MAPTGRSQTQYTECVIGVTESTPEIDVLSNLMTDLRRLFIPLPDSLCLIVRRYGRLGTSPTWANIVSRSLIDSRVNSTSVPAEFLISLVLSESLSMLSYYLRLRKTLRRVFRQFVGLRTSFRLGLRILETPRAIPRLSSVKLNPLVENKLGSGIPT